MRVRRGYLFWGLFFVLLGGIPLAERSGLIEGDQLAEIGRLWPLALIAIGIAVVMARSGIALVGTIVAALVLGGIAGGTLAYGSGWFLDFGDCAGVGSADLTRTRQSGTFTGPSSVDLVLNCGTLDVQAGTATESLTAWALDARHRGAPPTISSSGTELEVRAPETGARRQEWTLFLPGPQLDGLAMTVNAASATADVSGGILTTLALQANASDVRIVATGATISDLDVQLNAGRLRMQLGSEVTGTIQVNAGAVDLCVPTTATLSIEVGEDFAFATNLADRGLTRSGDVWTRAGGGAGSVELQVEGNASAFNLDPTGGCG